MSSEVKANKISPATGTALQISDSGDTTTIPSGATLAIASGATIANSGTATGFSSSAIVVAHMSVSQTLAKNVSEKVDFDTELYDTNGEYSTVDMRFTPTTAGYYFVSMTLVKGNGETQINTFFPKFYKNGAAYFASSNYLSYDYYQMERTTPTLSTIIYCNGSTDYVESWVEWGANGTLTIEENANGVSSELSELIIFKVD